MTEEVFRKHVIISSVLTVIAIAIIIGFCLFMFDRYSLPSEENTSITSGTVTDVYFASGAKDVMIEMSNGDLFQLVCPWLPRNLYTTIGYDLTQLSELLEGKDIEYRRMNKLPWVVEIYVDDIVIDNSKLTSEEMTVTRISIVILGIIMLAFPIGGDVLYLKAKYKCYAKAEKKRMRKLNRI